jgi:hypothetical protein
MQTFYAMVAALVIVVGIETVVLATDCEVPAFLIKGKTYKISLGLGGSFATILEIDKQSCWVKIESKRKSEFTGKEITETVWVNLRQVVMIEETQ